MKEIILFSVFTSLGVLVGSVVGFAGALVAVPFILIFIAPKIAVPAYSLVTLLTNLVVVYEARHHLDWRRISLLSIAGVMGTLAGAWSLAYLHTGIIRLIVSAVTLTFGLLFLAKVPIRLPEGWSIETALGLLSGWLGGIISQGGPPAVFLALARGWSKEAFRVNLMAYFFIINTVSVLAYWYYGLFTSTGVRFCAAAFIPVLLMATLGIWIKNRVDERLFRTVVLILIVLVGLAGFIPR